MAFNWTNDLIGKIEAADYQEIKNNADYLAQTISKTLTWTAPIGVGYRIKKQTLIEFQNNVDYLDDNKVCLHYCSSLDSTIDSSKNNTIHNNEDTGFYNNQDSQKLSGRNNNVEANNDTTYKSLRNIVVWLSYNGQYNDQK